MLHSSAVLVDGCCHVVLLQFFEKAAENVKENVGDDVQTDHLIKEACRNVLEHVSPPRCPPIVHSAKVILMRAACDITAGVTCQSAASAGPAGISPHDL